MNKIENDEKKHKQWRISRKFWVSESIILANYLYKSNQAKNEQIVNQVNDVLIGWTNTVNKKIIPENENPNKIIDIV